MPIYEYRCGSCGTEKEYLQKLGDAPITDCPSCGALAMTKLVSAAGFQLKGSGWYATDFKGGTKPPEKDSGKPEEAKETKEAKEAKETKQAATEPACGAGACPACQPN